MRKIGYFFASFLPCLLTLGLQFLAVFFMMGIAVLFLFPVTGGLSQNAGGMDALWSLLSDTDFNMVVMLIYAVTNIVVFGMWYYRSCGGEYLPKPSRTFTLPQLAGIVILVPGTQFACSYLISFLSVLFPRWLEQYENLVETSGLDSSMTVVLFLYSVVLGPIGEELIFRGVTMRLAKQSLPFWLANLFQALLFGAFHMNWLQGCYAFALGILLGFVCEKGGSIYYSVLLHILFNFWGMIISDLLGNVEATALVGILMFVTMIVSLVLGCFLFNLGMKRKKRKIALMDQPPAPAPSVIYP